jgi:hypothetical protein
MISERVKAAKAAAKARGKKFRLALCSKKWQRHVTALGQVAIQKAAEERAEAYRLHIEWALRQPNPYRYWSTGPISYRAPAKKLNDRNIQSPMGRLWTGKALVRGRRLGIDHPLSNVPQEVVRARVRAIWKERPEITSEQVRAIVAPVHPLGKDNAYKLLRAIRTAAANRCSVHRRLRWRIDCRTPTRIRISKVYLGSTSHGRVSPGLCV